MFWNFFCRAELESPNHLIQVQEEIGASLGNPEEKNDFSLQCAKPVPNRSRPNLKPRFPIPNSNYRKPTILPNTTNCQSSTSTHCKGLQISTNPQQSANFHFSGLQSSISSQTSLVRDQNASRPQNCQPATYRPIVQTKRSLGAPQQNHPSSSSTEAFVKEIRKETNNAPAIINNPAIIANDCQNPASIFGLGMELLAYGVDPNELFVVPWRLFYVIYLNNAKSL